MKILSLCVALVTCGDRGPRPTVKIGNNTDLVDYEEVDIAGTLMDLFNNQQFSSNLSFEPGDKIRVLSNIVKIQLDEVSQDEHSNPISISNDLKPTEETDCKSKVIFVSSSYWLIILNIVTLIITFSTFVLSIILIYKAQEVHRSRLYFPADNKYNNEQVSLTSSCQ